MGPSTGSVADQSVTVARHTRDGVHGMLRIGLVETSGAAHYRAGQRGELGAEMTVGVRVSDTSNDVRSAR
jgi:hypothetical protein